MTEEVKLPFARSADTGKIVSIDAVERGLSCKCHCPKCGAEVVAVQGNILAHHFRHYVSSIGNCIGARETAIHLFAKQVICNTASKGWDLKLPGFGTKMISAQSEVQIHGIRPDVLVQCTDEQIAVEILVAHRVPPEKIEIYARHQLTSIEIDLSYYRHIIKDEEAWEDAILHDAPRWWLVPCKAIRNAKQLKAEEDIAREREKERLALLRLEEAYRQKQNAKTVSEMEYAIRLEQDRQFELDRTQRILRDKINYAKNLEVKQFLIEARERAYQPPDLHQLIRAYGDYSKITPDAWRQYDTDMEAYRAYLRSGDAYR